MALRSSGARPVISRLSDLEVLSTLRRKSLDGHLTVCGAEIAVTKFRGHQAAQFYERMVINGPVFSIAEDLIEQHGDFVRPRSLDLLHVATALHYRVDGFATYDAELRVLAHRVGLQLL